MGLKRDMGSKIWCQTILSEAERNDAVSIILEADGLQADTSPCATNLENKTKAKLEILAVAMGIKRARVGWATCCPPRGNKPDIVSALLKAWKFSRQSQTELQELAIEKHIK